MRLQHSNPDDVAHLCTVASDPVPLPDMLDTVDHVYTITSLAGFEALMRGIPVTVFGCPFYAGWGLTDDRQVNPRRGRQLGIEQLFAAAYLIYPRYFNPVTGEASSFEACVHSMSAWRRDGMPQDIVTRQSRPDFAIWGPYGLLGWRHLLTPMLMPIVRKLGNSNAVEDFRRSPINFFRELNSPKHRLIGRIFYPWDEE